MSNRGSISLGMVVVIGAVMVLICGNINKSNPFEKEKVGNVTSQLEISNQDVRLSEFFTDEEVSQLTEGSLK